MSANMSPALCSISLYLDPISLTNTIGTDIFIYSDEFPHETWCSLDDYHFESDSQTPYVANFIFDSCIAFYNQFDIMDIKV